MKFLTSAGYYTDYLFDEWQLNTPWVDRRDGSCYILVRKTDTEATFNNQHGNTVTLTRADAEKHMGPT